MRSRILEEIECNLLDESLDGPFKSKIDDIDGISRHANSNPLPIPSSEKRIWMIPFQYKCLDPDCAVSYKEASRKWMTEQEEFISVREDVPELFRDVLAVHYRFDSFSYSHKKILPCELEFAKKRGVLENCWKRIRKAFGEVKDFFRIF